MDIIARQEPVWRHVLELSHLGLVSFARDKAKEGWLGIKWGLIYIYYVVYGRSTNGPN